MAAPRRAKVAASVATAVFTALLGVAINFATEWKENWAAWVAVVALSALLAGLAAFVALDTGDSARSSSRTAGSDAGSASSGGSGRAGRRAFVAVAILIGVVVVAFGLRVMSTGGDDTDAGNDTSEGTPAGDDAHETEGGDVRTTTTSPATTTTSDISDAPIGTSPALTSTSVQPIVAEAPPTTSAASPAGPFQVVVDNHDEGGDLVFAAYQPSDFRTLDGGHRGSAVGADQKTGDCAMPYGSWHADSVPQGRYLAEAYISDVEGLTSSATYDGRITIDQAANRGRWIRLYEVEAGQQYDGDWTVTVSLSAGNYSAGAACATTGRVTAFDAVRFTKL